mgnify:CR=1 FL=1
MNNINNLINQVSKYDTELAKEIRRYIDSRKYGLVYEKSKPEFVRLPNKMVVEGDIVNILPPRGISEKKTDIKCNEKWRVLNIKNGLAELSSLERNEVKTVNFNDLIAIARFDQPIYTGLKEVDRIECDKNKSFNILINGENFHALETLMYPYQRKVDCIYIDPPYNTGDKDWKYNNDYVGPDDSYRHSKWLTFMEDRLRLAKKLLNPNDSVLICTIDEKEYNRLGILLEQIFPNSTIQMISDVINPKGVSRSGFSRNDEYIYFVMLGKAAPARLNLNSEWSSSATIKDIKHKKGVTVWTSMMRRGTGATRSQSPGCYYPIFADPNSKIIKKIGEPIPEGQHRAKDIDGLVQILPIRSNGDEGRWQIGVDELKSRLKQGRIKLGKRTDYGFVVNYIPKGAYSNILDNPELIKGRNKDGSLIVDNISDNNSHVAPTQWKISSHNASEKGSTFINGILGNKRFSYPKSLYSTADAIRFFVANKPNALILDFFAGSGTTAHSVALLNAEDNGNRRCICITNNEVGAKEAEELTKRKLRPGDSQWEKLGIAHYVAWPRIKGAYKGVNINGEPLKGSYGSYTNFYVPVKDKVFDKNNKQISKNLYSIKKEPEYPKLADKKLSDGFKENAIFFDLEYLEPAVVSSDMAFNDIAPLLWMKAGAQGRIIKHNKKYDITDVYAVLFNYKYIKEFTEKIKALPQIKTIFIVTDLDSQYQDMCNELKDRKVYKLYESYLKSFEVQSLN